MFFSRFVLALAVMIYRSSFVLGLKYHYPSLTSLQIGYLLSYNALMGSSVGFVCSFIYSHPIYHKKEEKLQVFYIGIVFYRYFTKHLEVFTHCIEVKSSHDMTKKSVIADDYWRLLC